MTQPNSADYGVLGEAFAVRDELAAAASMLAETEVTRASGGVTVTLAASGEMRAIKIDPSVIHDVATLERDVMLAHEAAATAVRQMGEDMLSPLRDLVAKATQSHHGHAEGGTVRRAL